MLCSWGSRQIPVLETKTLYEHWSLSVRLFRKGKQQLGLLYLVTLNFKVFYILVYSRECVCVHYICCFYNLLSFYFDFIFHYKHTLMTRMKICLVIIISVSYHMFNVFLCLPCILIYMCVCVYLYIYIYIYIYIVLCVKGITGAIKHLSFSHQIW